MNLIWSSEAAADLAAVRAYIEQDDPVAAQRVALHIIHNVESLLSKALKWAGRVESRGHANS
jgi:plasmid stabilization system protein ParE